MMPVIYPRHTERLPAQAGGLFLSGKAASVGLAVRRTLRNHLYRDSSEGGRELGRSVGGQWMTGTAEKKQGRKIRMMPYGSGRTQRGNLPATAEQKRPPGHVSRTGRPVGGAFGAVRRQLAVSVMTGFAFFLTAAAQPHAGQGSKTLGRNGVAAFTAAGHAIDPVGAALI